MKEEQGKRKEIVEDEGERIEMEETISAEGTKVKKW